MKEINQNMANGHNRTYDIVIVGAGASGLFLGALLDMRGKSGLIVEASHTPGRKIMVSGGGRCNFTHAGSIKDFPAHYGETASFVRTPLYKFSNHNAADFFEKNGINTTTKDDGRMFPDSGRSRDIRDLLISLCTKNGWRIITDTAVKSISQAKDGIWKAEYETKGSVNSGKSTGYLTADNIVISTGGLSWKGLGIGGSMLRSLASLGINIVRPVPGLTSIGINNHRLSELSGITLSDTKITVRDQKTDASRKKGRGGKSSSSLIKEGSVLITEAGFSGPAVINSSTAINRMILNSNSDPIITISLPEAYDELRDLDISGVSKSILHLMEEKSSLPSRYISMMLSLSGIDSSAKASSVPVKKLRSCISGMCNLVYDKKDIVKPSFDGAMLTSGGVNTSEINNKTFECMAFKGLYVTGEALDVSGDTGGYNLQFAWSSAAAAARSLAGRI